MSALPDILDHGTAAIRAVATRDGLAAIRHPDAPPGFADWIGGLDPHNLPITRAILRPPEVRDAARAMCDACHMPEGAHRAWLIDDITALADIVAALFDVPFLRLRMNAVTTNACRRFHVDRVPGRLICTYRGTGTEFGIAAGGGEPDQVTTVPTAMPIVLRGTLWPERPRSGLVHRSPPIEGSGETRSVLVLDPIADPEDEN